MKRCWPILGAAAALVSGLACGDGAGPNNTGAIARIVVKATDSALTGPIVVNDSLQLEVILLDSIEQVLPARPVSWRSADPLIATVSSTGIVVGVKAGQDTITATVGDKSGIYVTDVLPHAASLDFLPPRLGLVPGGVYDLAVIFRDSAGTQLESYGRRIEWRSSAPDVAQVEGNNIARVTGIAPGSSILTATGSDANASIEVDVTTIRFTTVFAGAREACGVSAKGVPYCWGVNLNNRLAAPYGESSITPLRAEGLGSVVSVVSGGSHACALTLIAEAYCWGYGVYGQIGDGSADPAIGGVVPPRKTSGGLHFASLTLGDVFSCGVTTAGSAYCWGGSTDGMLGNGTEELVTATPVPVSGGLTFMVLRTHPFGRSVCGLVIAGQAYCWGRNEDGELGDGTTEMRTIPAPVAGGFIFTSIAVGMRHACGLVADGTAYCWGNNEWGQLGQSGSHLTPSPVDGDLKFTAMAAGADHTCGVTVSGSAYCWGNNGQGQLGNGTMTPASSPVLVSGGLSFRQISAGYENTCALTDTEVAYCWGNGETVGSLPGATTSIPVMVHGQP